MVSDMREIKNSGIPWIGDMPLNWIVCPFPMYFESIVDYRGKTPEKVDEGIFLVTARNIKDGKMNYDNAQEYVRQEDYDIIMHRGLPHIGDVLFTTEAPLGEVANVDRTDIALAQRVIKFSGKRGVLDNYFLKYWIYNPAFQDDLKSFGTGSTAQGIKASKLNQLKLVLPPFSEQQCIVTFLDSKCAEIDSLYTDIEEQIKTLEEYKRSVITEAVTKGLNPEAEMKDSGIEWVGEIPSHWHIHPVYSCFGERKNKNSALKENNLLSLSYGKIIQKDINTVGGLLPLSFNTYNIVEAGDIIIRPTDLQNDKRSLRTGLVRERGIITSAYIDLMPKSEINSEFFHYLLHSYDVQKVFYNMGNGVRQGLNYSEFSRLMIFSPPINEQKQIADYLNSKCSEIEAIIGNKKEQLELLEEYKKSLIYEYVTGKKEVVTNE